MLLDESCARYWEKWKTDNYDNFIEKVEHTDNENLSVFTEVVKCRMHNEAWVSDINNILTPENFWRKFVICLSTTRAPSGPDSLVQVLALSNDSILDYRSSVYQHHQSEFQLKEDLKTHIREFANINKNCVASARLNIQLPKYVAKAWRMLFLRKEIDNYINILINVFDKGDNQSKESARAREIYAAKILTKLPGIGLKQSRNILQYLGISRTVIPIDSRWCKILSNRQLHPKNANPYLIKVLQAMDSPKMASQLLQRDKYYLSLEDYLIEVGQYLSMPSYVLDSVMFFSFDDK